MQYTDLPPRTLEFVLRSHARGLHVLALQTAEEQGNVFDAKQRVTSFRVPHSKVFLAKWFARRHVSVLSNPSIEISDHHPKRRTYLIPTLSPFVQNQQFSRECFRSHHRDPHARLQRERMRVRYLDSSVLVFKSDKSEHSSALSLEQRTYRPRRKRILVSKQFSHLRNATIAIQ